MSPICKACDLRPAGCWKDQEYGCACAFNAAGNKAEELGLCPLELLPYKSAEKTLIFMFQGNGQRFERRLSLCAKTWMKDAVELNQDVLVVRAGTKPNRVNELWFDTPDDIGHISLQMRLLMEFLLGRKDWTWLFKCDNDTYVSIPRFLRYSPTGYTGYHCGWPSYAHGGGGYWLNRDMASVLAKKLPDSTYPKDREVGRLLREAGFPFRHDGRFVGEGTRDRLYPMQTNRVITTHRVSDSVWYRAHYETGLGGLPPLPPESPGQRVNRLRGERQAILGRRLVAMG